MVPEKRKLLATEFKMAAILNSVRLSGLNFNIQETPYSFYICVRKSTSNSPQVQILEPSQVGTNLDSSIQIGQLKTRCCFLENALENMKKDCVDAVDELEEKTKIVLDLENENESLREKLTESKIEFDKSLALRVKNVIEEKRQIQIKHERVCAENKNLKDEIDTGKKELNAANVALKYSKRDMKDASYKAEKDLVQLRDKTKDLEEFKKVKLAEEKDLKAKVRKCDKKLKSLADKEAKLEVDRANFNRKSFGPKQDNENNDETSQAHLIKLASPPEFVNCDDNQNNSCPLEPTALGYTSVSQTSLLTPTRLNSSLNPTSLDPSSMIHTTLEANSMNHTSLDPTFLMSNMGLNMYTYTSATNSLESNRSHPNRIKEEPASSTLGELLKELEKNTQKLSSKMDKWTSLT